MRLVIIGLGKMGLNMCKRLLRDPHSVYAFDRSPEKVREASAAGTMPVKKLEDIKQLAAPRLVWVMVPAGPPTAEVMEKLSSILSPGDLVIDSDNSSCKDSIEPHRALAARGIDFLDVGTSGGIWGLEVGYCLMVGGAEGPFRRAEPILRSLAPKDVYMLVGGPGSGHNGIEYGLMQAYAEGFEILRASGRASICKRSPISGTKAASYVPGCSNSPSWLLPETQN